jgi:hypothetical protein
LSHAASRCTSAPTAAQAAGIPLTTDMLCEGKSGSCRSRMIRTRRLGRGLWRFTCSVCGTSANADDSGNVTLWLAPRRVGLLDPFAGRFTPLVVSFWHQPLHWLVLSTLAANADELEAIRYEFGRIQNGERNVLGHPCLCATLASTPPAARGGSGSKGNPTEGLLALKLDLQRAADVALPLTWHATHVVFRVQGREAILVQRLQELNRVENWRNVDLEAEPCEREPGTMRVRHRCFRLAFERMAAALGWSKPEQAEEGEAA